MMQTSEKVTLYRTQKGWTKLELAKQTGLSDSHISQIENGRRNPTLPTLKKLAGALGVPYYELQNPHHIGMNIRKYRTQKGMTMKDVEILSGLSNGHLCKIEKGVRRRLNEETLLKISMCLNVAPDELLAPAI